jgi:hypothetical protein
MGGEGRKKISVRIIVAGRIMTWKLQSSKGAVS